MTVVVRLHDRSVIAREQLNLDARKGQEARLIGALRLRGVRGDIDIRTNRTDGVAFVKAVGFQ